MYNVLVCDDEKDIVAALKIYLESEGFNVFCAYNGREALKTAKENEIHLAILDIMMPEKNGIETMVELREISNLPVILLTAKSEDSDIILGLNVGADDYITKPFNPVEVIARVRSQIRRYMQLGSGSAAEDVLRAGELELDAKKKEVTKGEAEINLTPTEFEILRLLMSNPGEVFSPKDIYIKVWNDTPLGAEATVAVHIRHIREKIEVDPASPQYIKVVWGQGYKFEGGMKK